MTINKIRESENYYITTGKSSENPDLICYHIVNKKTGVIEVECSMLPQAIKFMGDLEAALAAMDDMASDAPDLLPVYPGRSKTVN